MVIKKLWANRERLKSIVGIYIALLLILPFISMGISYLCNGSDIENGVKDALKMALIDGLKWYGIVIAAITIIFLILFIFSADIIEFNDKCIKCHNVFSKRFREISCGTITQVVFCDGLWHHKGEYYRGRKIIFLNKNDIVFEPEISPELCLAVILNMPENKIWLVNENSNLMRINDYFQIDFKVLSYGQQFTILKYYCKVTRTKYKTGEEILRK